MKNELISCIIPTYNRAYCLKRAIDSVLAQSDDNLELIVVDDGSTDETAEVLATYQDRPGVKILSQANRGVSAARNFGAEHAKGEWLAFLDSDDEWLPEKLSLQRRIWESSAELLWVHGEEIWVRQGKRVNPKKIHRKSGGDIFERSLKLCLVSPSAVVLRSELYAQYGGFDESFTVCEDYDLWLRLSNEHEVGFCETPVVIKYGGHEDQLSSRYKAMDHWRLRSLLQLLETNGLSPERQNKVLEEFLRKAEILLTGYKKHNREQDRQQVSNMVKRALKYQHSSEESL
jgi:glycosyltransferase involved in cell wall biosynthesis